MTRLSRRRFLQISASAAGLAATTGMAQASTWSGHALGAEVSITLRGDHAKTAALLRDVQSVLADIEAHFSLYHPMSDLVRLNTLGTLARPSKMWIALLANVDTIHGHTQGHFDPTVQTLWLSDGSTDSLGWDKVRWSPDEIALAPGQAITLNGIAQGYASDHIASLLQAAGFTDALINIGEFVGLGGPWRLGLSDPIHGHLGTRALTNAAIATTSPTAMVLPDGRSHVVDPKRPKAPLQWSTVSVEASTATVADALSTAFGVMDIAGIETALGHRQDVKRVTLVDQAGDISTLRA